MAVVMACIFPPSDSNLLLKDTFFTSLYIDFGDGYSVLLKCLRKRELTSSTWEGNFESLTQH